MKFIKEMTNVELNNYISFLKLQYVNAKKANYINIIQKRRKLKALEEKLAQAKQEYYSRFEEKEM